MVAGRPALMKALAISIAVNFDAAGVVAGVTVVVTALVVVAVAVGVELEPQAAKTGIINARQQTDKPKRRRIRIMAAA